MFPKLGHFEFRATKSADVIEIDNLRVLDNGKFIRCCFTILSHSNMAFL